MPACELCGKEAPLVTALVEGADVEVCPRCSQHGTIKRKISSFATSSRPVKSSLPEEKVVDNFASLLHQAREKKALTQEDFAKLLQERQGMIIKWESGTLQPEIQIAKKIGKMLGLQLVEIEKTETTPLRAQKSGVLTLGDMIKVRKRQKDI